MAIFHESESSCDCSLDRNVTGASKIISSSSISSPCASTGTEFAYGSENCIGGGVGPIPPSFEFVTSSEYMLEVLQSSCNCGCGVGACECETDCVNGNGGGGKDGGLGRRRSGIGAVMWPTAWHGGNS